MISFLELRDIARRQGFIRWAQSGIIERLAISRTNQRYVIAFGLYGEKPHVLNGRSLLWMYHAAEIPHPEVFASKRQTRRK